MIAQTTAAPLMILDPTFRQFSAAGLPPISVIGAVSSATPDDGVWRVYIPQTDIEIAYFTADAVEGWEEDFEAVKPQLAGDVETLTRWFRAGRSAEELQQHVIPPTFFPNEQS
ncbi:MAG: hypothetical protein ABL886_07185 [Rhodoglobus sp.]